MRDSCVVSRFHTSERGTDIMAHQRPQMYKYLTSDERHKAIKTFCRQQNPLKKTAARLDAHKAQKAREEEEQLRQQKLDKETPVRAATRCRSPQSPPRNTRARRSTCATCAAFARRDATRTASGRARSVKGPVRRRYDGTGAGTYSVLETHRKLTTGQASMQEAKVRGTDPCDARLQEEERPRERLPARGPARWQRPKCHSPTILNPTQSDVPWGGTPRERLLPERPPRIVSTHPLEHRAKSSPLYWQQQFQKLEDQVRGPMQDVKQTWDALTPSILHRVAPILGIPFPAAGYDRADADLIPSEYTPPSADKSLELPVWDEMSLPEEILSINIKPSELEMKDWRFVDIPERQEALKKAQSSPKAEISKDKMGVKVKESKEGGDEEAKVEKTLKVVSLGDKTLDAETSVQESTYETTDTVTKETTTQKRLPTGQIVEVTEIEVMEKTAEEPDYMMEETRDIDNREYIEAFPSFTDFERIREEREAELQEKKDKEALGEHFFEEYGRRKPKEKKEPWGGELVISDSYLEARRAIIGSEALEEEMSEILDLINVDLEVHPPTLYPREEGLFTCPGRPDNPYFNFISKSPKRAAVWREHFKPETTGEAMDTAVLLHPDLNLPEKANHVTKMITSEFVEWIHGLGGATHTEITEDLLRQLFDVTFDMPAAHSLCVRVRELPVVTKQIAQSCHADQAEEQQGLRRAVRGDLAAETRRQHLTAFQKTLDRCCPQRFIAPHNKVRETWVECRVPQGLATSRNVFEGITQLISVQRFCEWLEKHPKFDPPEYLKRVGMVGTKDQRAFARRLASQSVRFTEDSIAEAGFVHYSLSQPGVRRQRPSRSSRASVASGRRSTVSLGTRRDQAFNSGNLERLHKSLSAARSLAVL